MENKIDELKQMEAFKELLEAKITGLKKELEQEEQEEKKFPQHDDEFYFIDELGDVIHSYYEEDCIGDEKRKYIGNCFRTREKAEFEIERLKVLKELKRFSKPFDSTKVNNYLVFWEEGHLVGVQCDSYDRIDTNYFESEEKAQEAIKAVGEERLKKYYFGIEE